MARRHLTLRFPLLGLALGFVLSQAGFADPAEQRAMFLFERGRLLATFAGGIALATLGFALLAGRLALARRPLHRGTVPGGLLFGAGWTLCGACPAVVLVQIGEGRLGALATVGGILAGTWLGKRASAALRLDSGSCS